MIIFTRTTSFSHFSLRNKFSDVKLCPKGPNTFMATGSASAIFHSHLTPRNDPITKGRKKAGLNLMYPAQGPREAGPPVWQTALKMSGLLSCPCPLSLESTSREGRENPVHTTLQDRHWGCSAHNCWPPPCTEMGENWAPCLLALTQRLLGRQARINATVTLPGEGSNSPAGTQWHRVGGRGCG